MLKIVLVAAVVLLAGPRISTLPNTALPITYSDKYLCIISLYHCLNFNFSRLSLFIMTGL